MSDERWEPRERPDPKDGKVWDTTATTIRDWGVELWYWGRAVRHDILVLEECINRLIAKDLLSEAELQEIRSAVDSYLDNQDPAPEPDTGGRGRSRKHRFGLGPGKGDPDDPPPPPWKRR